MPTRTMTWGRAMKFDVEEWCDEHGFTHKELVGAMNTIERGVQNSYAKLFRLESAPKRYEDQLRAYLTALIIDRDPGFYGLRVIRPALWPEDSELRDRLHQELTAMTGRATSSSRHEGADLLERVAA